MKKYLVPLMLWIGISVANIALAQPTCPLNFDVQVTNPRDCNTNYTDGRIVITPNYSVIDPEGSPMILYTVYFNPDALSTVSTQEFSSFNIVWNRPELNGSFSPANLTPGDYKYTITYIVFNEDTCTVVDNVALAAQPLALNCQAVSLGNNEPTRIIAGMNGGIPPYKLFWSGPVSGSHNNILSGELNIDGLPYGTYTFELRDSVQCGASCQITIAPDCNIDLVLVKKDTPKCANSQDGRIEVTAVGGQGSVNYQWNTGHDGAILNNVGAGTYLVVATDELNCSDTLLVELGAPASLDLVCEMTRTDNVMKGGGEGQVRLNAGGGSPPYQLQWSQIIPPNTTVIGNSSLNQSSLEIDLPTGFYLFKATDSKGCIDTCRADVWWELIVKANEDIVVEYLPETAVAEAQGIHERILENDQARAIDSCWYYNGFYRIYQYHTLANINLSDQGVKTPVKTDTSDLKNLRVNPIDISSQSNDFCIYSPGAGNKQHKVVVAVIDSGMDLKSPLNSPGHPGLVGINWINPNEILSLNDPKDDDDNKLVDDIDGYDYVNDSINIHDSLGHGTHLAGIIADAFPGEIELDLINMKVKDLKGGDVFDLACALNYAIDEGADVINLSLGYYHVDYFSPLYSVLQRARDSSIVVVVSAGNEGGCLNRDSLGFCIDLATNQQWGSLDTLRWPVAFKSKILSDSFNIEPLNNIIVIAALDTLEEERIANYSNVGQSMVDVAARGTFKSTYLNAEYKVMAGTSMAAAHVSRLIALIKAYRPATTPVQIINAITSMCDLHPSMSNLLSSSGCVNADRTLANLGINPAVLPINRVIDNGKPASFSYEGENQFKGKLRITLGNGQKYYSNVEMVIVPLLKPNEVVFRKKFCEINIIRWDGSFDNGNKITNGSYWVKLFVNGEEITSASRSIKLIVP